ncbi:AAA family ATPase [Thermus albus]|uniref:AAA family ATPase n=1 Tax=Thermus albus TaxID=2908146 RepID=UPI001FAAA683|nr:AAA family ATPase [Thermus albus]
MASIAALGYLLTWSFLRTGKPAFFSTGAAVVASITFGVLLLTVLFLLLGMMVVRPFEPFLALAFLALLPLTAMVWQTLRAYRLGHGWTLWQRAAARSHYAEGPGVGRVSLRKEAELDFQELEKTLKARVLGQDEAVETILRGLKRKAAGFTRREKPFSAMLLGPTGTGKTELAKALADALGRPLIRYDMNAFGQEHTASGLVGSPPGFVGSETPGRLYEDLLRAPDAVVLFDEMEKAHPFVLDPLLQLLDEGRFQELSRGLVVQAPEAILLFTTNLLTDVPEGADLRGLLVGRGLRPELVNRLDAVVAFRPFTRETLEALARKTLSDYLETWKREKKLSFTLRVDDAVYRRLVDLCDLRFGARDLQRVMENTVGDALAEAYLARGGKPFSKLHLYVQGDELVAELS